VRRLGRRGSNIIIRDKGTLTVIIKENIFVGRIIFGDRRY